MRSAGGGEEGEEPAKGLFALPFMRRAQERRRVQAQADAAAILRELEAADALSAGGSDEDDDDWTAAQPAERSGRLRFGSSRQQPQDEVCLFVPTCNVCSNSPSLSNIYHALLCNACKEASSFLRGRQLSINILDITGQHFVVLRGRTSGFHAK